MPSSPSSSTTDSNSLSRTSSVSSISSISESGECEVDSRSNSTALVEKSRRRARNYIRRGKRMAGLDVTALDQLPPSMLVYPKSPKKRRVYPERYHFGFGLSLGQLYDYCVAQDLAPKHYQGKILYHIIMVNKAVEEISRRCGAKLYLQDIRNVEYEWVLAHYSNYTWRRNRMPDHAAQLVVDVIQRELCICEPPKWFRE